MELEELYALMERFARSGLTDLEWEREGEKIALRRSAAPVVVSAPSAAPAGQAAPAQAGAAAPVRAGGRERGGTVYAPLVGTFYAAPAPGEEAFAAPGKQVKKGETLCLIEAMKMMSEIPAPADCVVEEVLARDGEAVGFGEPLFRIRRV